MRTNSNLIRKLFHPKYLARGTNNHILQISPELADYRGEDIRNVIHRAIDTFARLQHASSAGWFRLLNQGKLFPLCPSLHALPAERSIFKAGLRALPWCHAQVEAGRAAVIGKADDAVPEMRSDLEFLKRSQISSLAILPSNTGDLGRTALILVSGTEEINWPKDIHEQATLLIGLLANSERHRIAQREIRAYRQSFDRLFIGINHPMALLDHSGRFVSANAAFIYSLGYEHEELKKLKYADIVDTNGRQRVATCLTLSSWKSTKKIHDEQTLICKDLTSLSTDITLCPLGESGLGVAHSILAIEALPRENRYQAELNKRELEIQMLASQLIRSQEIERRRLSRELHDDIGQRLSLAASGVALLVSQENGRSSSGRLDSIRNELDSLCSDLHCMSHNLHSYKLQHLGLKFAMKDLSRQFQNSDFQVDLHIDEFDEPEDEDVALCLYRVAQEALNNALKHAHADTAAVVLTKLDGMFYMTIQDSGIGFQQEKVSRGLGLISMSERLKLLGGEFRLHSSLGHGTEIWVSVPAAASGHMRKN